MNSVRSMSDEQLIEHVEQAAAQERDATVQLIALLAEMDARRLFLGQGYSSLFVYCTKRLHLSEHAAYGRIEAARAARKCRGRGWILATRPGRKAQRAPRYFRPRGSSSPPFVYAGGT